MVARPHHLSQRQTNRHCRRRNGADAGFRWKATRRRVVGTIPSPSPNATARSMSASSGSNRLSVLIIGAMDCSRGGSRSACRRTSRLFTYNKSLECCCGTSAGAASRGVDRGFRAQPRRCRQFAIISDRRDHVTRFSIKRTEDFDVSDCTIIPPDDLLLLERRFSIVRGIGMRMRRVPLSSLKEGARARRPFNDRSRSRLSRSITWKEFQSIALLAAKRSSRLYPTTISRSPAQSAAAIRSGGAVNVSAIMKWRYPKKTCMPDMRPSVADPGLDRRVSLP